MKMKRACEATSLTERAIRLYLKKELLSPRLIGGIIDFSDQDIQKLKDIALLRQFDFSIEQIARMLHDPAAIPDVVRLRMDSARANAERESDFHVLLSTLNLHRLGDVHSIAAQLRERSLAPPCPNFARFDEISNESRLSQAESAFRVLSRSEQRRKIRRILLICAGTLSILIALAILFLSQTRISGLISVAPLTVLESIGGQTVSVRLHNEHAIDAIGRDALTIPCRSYGSPLENGESLEHACQLAVELTNYDLVRLGINPLQRLRTQSAGVNDAWTKWILRTLFNGDYADNAVLWIREPCNLPPIFGWKQ